MNVKFMCLPGDYTINIPLCFENGKARGGIVRIKKPWENAGRV